MSDAARKAKRIDDLSWSDFAESAIWEFTAGRDETWVRPVRRSTIPRKGSSLQVAADFTLGDRTVIPGFVEITTDEGNQFGLGPFRGFTLFCPGCVLHIQSAQPDPREVRHVVRELGKPWECAFPIRFELRALVDGENEVRTGEIDGDLF